MPFGWFEDFDLFAAAFQNKPLKDQMKDWLYGEWTEQKVREFEVLHNIPVISNYMDYLLDYRADQEYLDRYGMDWTDVHDPRKLSSVSSGSSLVGASLQFVSKNVERLYR